MCNDLTEMDMFYVVPGNSRKLWTPEPTTNRTTVVAPRLLALPPDCVSFCAVEQRTPYELAKHIQGILGASKLEESKYAVMLDWCCMAAQADPLAGDAVKSSQLAFSVTPIIGSQTLHKWASARLAATLGPAKPTGPSQAPPQGHMMGGQPQTTSTPGTPQQMDVSLVAQVTAAVLAALRASGTTSGGGGEEATIKQTEDAKVYSTFQLAKLKGFCGVLDNCDIPPIWDYFRTTKDVDAHRTKLLECMSQWA